MCEQLWALLKPLTSLTRYMAMPNYLDCIDDFFGFVAAARLADFVPFMVQQHRSTVRKLGERPAAWHVLSSKSVLWLACNACSCGWCIAVIIIMLSMKPSLRRHRPPPPSHWSGNSAQQSCLLAGVPAAAVQSSAHLW